MTFRGGDLINYYAERNKRTGRHTYGGRGGGYAQHGWRRSGGTALMHLERFGFAERVDISWGTPLYVLTDAGREIGRKAGQEPPE